ncbi:uncharacterized protein RJT20DRAFT_16778 [Scheffersomyces xylosifermentans]|uniref:uncharacterized protein n=1 Tax=Scheffersomyces xylosifermentans TaxID=1304137 RepID=UPI00315D20D5
MSFVVSFRYDKQKYRELEASRAPSSQTVQFSQDEEFNSYTTMDSTPSKIVRLQYQHRNGLESPPIHSSPVRSSVFRSRNRAITPPTDVATSEFTSDSNTIAVTRAEIAQSFQQETNRIGSYSNSNSGLSSHVSPSSQLGSSPDGTYTVEPYVYPAKSYQDALKSINEYSQKFVSTPRSEDGTISVIHNQQVEQEWYGDLKVVADRLHLLREAHRAVQLIKKRKISGKFDIGSSQPLDSSNNPTTTNSPLNSTPFGSDDEDQVQENENLSQQEEDDSSSNSATDSTLPLGRRTPRKRVQFQV